MYYIGLQIPIFNSSHLDKMDATLADDVFKGIFLNENDKIPIWRIVN